MRYGGGGSYNIFTNEELERILKFVEARLALDKMDKREDEVNKSIKEKIEKELK